jgi:hypothetical protein
MWTWPSNTLPKARTPLLLLLPPPLLLPVAFEAAVVLEVLVLQVLVLVLMGLVRGKRMEVGLLWVGHARRDRLCAE